MRRGVDPRWLAAAAAVLALARGAVRAVRLALDGADAAAALGPARRRSPRGWPRSGWRCCAAPRVLACARGGAVRWRCFCSRPILPPARLGLLAARARSCRRMAALAREAAILAAARPGPPPLWLASLDGLIWAFAPAAVAGLGSSASRWSRRPACRLRRSCSARLGGSWAPPRRGLSGLLTTLVSPPHVCFRLGPARRPLAPDAARDALRLSRGGSVAVADLSVPWAATGWRATIGAHPPL